MKVLGCEHGRSSVGTADSGNMSEEAGLQLPDFEESDFYVEQEHVRRWWWDVKALTQFVLRRNREVIASFEPDKMWA